MTYGLTHSFSFLHVKEKNMKETKLCFEEYKKNTNSLTLYKNIKLKISIIKLKISIFKYEWYTFHRVMGDKRKEDRQISIMLL